MQTAIKQRPILMSTPMVQSTLEGRKTNTRRIVKADLSIYQHGDIIENNETWGWCLKRPCVTKEGLIVYEVLKQFKCPYGEIGEVLWVRETFVRGCIWDGEGPEPSYYDMIGEERPEPLKERIWYRADNDCPDEWHNEKKGEPGNIPWKPSIFMPYKVCRLFLRITDIRVERLQDITEEDAIAEGIKPKPSFESGTGISSRQLYENYLSAGYSEVIPIDSFHSLWESINGAGSWKNNPFCWVVSFERIDKPE